MISRYTMIPRDDGQWIASVDRHRYVDRDDPRSAQQALFGAGRRLETATVTVRPRYGLSVSRLKDKRFPSCEKNAYESLAFLGLGTARQCVPSIEITPTVPGTWGP